MDIISVLSCIFFAFFFLFFSTEITKRLKVPSSLSIALAARSRDRSDT